MSKTDLMLITLRLFLKFLVFFAAITYKGLSKKNLQCCDFSFIKCPGGKTALINE